eukprot:11221171-Lingulodinium_polyedra.AAC.1
MTRVGQTAQAVIGPVCMVPLVARAAPRIQAVGHQTPPGPSRRQDQRVREHLRQKNRAAGAPPGRSPRACRNGRP